MIPKAELATANESSQDSEAGSVCNLPHPKVNCALIRMRLRPGLTVVTVPVQGLNEARRFAGLQEDVCALS
jgi:hypothetical protein